MTTSLSTTAIWLMIAAIGAGTLMIRVSFLAVLGRVERIPPVVQRILRLIPAAVLAALVVPWLTHAYGEFDLATVRFGAGAVAALVAWKSKSVLVTITLGMATLWLLQAIA